VTVTVGNLAEILQTLATAVSSAWSPTDYSDVQAGITTVCTGLQGALGNGGAQLEDSSIALTALSTYLQDSGYQFNNIGSGLIGP